MNKAITGWGLISILAMTIGSAGLVAAADNTYGNPSGANTGASAQPDAAAPAQNNNMPGTMPASMGAADTAKPLPENWTKVKGTIQAVDTASRQVKLQDEKGNLSNVNIDPGVVIKKDGKQVAVAELQPGDRVIITRKKTAVENNKG